MWNIILRSCPCYLKHVHGSWWRLASTESLQGIKDLPPNEHLSKLVSESVSRTQNVHKYITYMKKLKRDFVDDKRLEFVYSMPTTFPPNAIEEMYYNTEVLEDLQMAEVYEDSKQLVDMKLKFPFQEILKRYKVVAQTKKGGRPLSFDVAKRFIEENFDESGIVSVFQDWKPKDWKPDPPILDKITDPTYKEFAKELNAVWLQLAKTQVPISKEEDNLTSSITLKNGIIIPGGRFREIYYWDSYWIIRGLLLCGMVDTARGMIQNLVDMVELFGHIPNGSRKYYVGRSQPPFLIKMVDAYYKITQDFTVVSDNIKTLDKEMAYWVREKRVVTLHEGKLRPVFRYFAKTPLPRPESYREDRLGIGLVAMSDRMKKFHYICIRSAAESGWDFSSRWYIKRGSNGGTLSDLATIFIAPVDLNSLMHFNFENMSEWHNRLGNKKQSDAYKNLADYQLQLLNHLFWNQEEGIWNDYDCINCERRNYFHVSNFFPLWTKSYTMNKGELAQRIGEYIDKYVLHQYHSGVPGTMERTTQQWDFPNAWPPCQGCFLEGLEQLDSPALINLSKDYTAAWLYSNYMGFKTYKGMFEKFDCTAVGEIGGAGEYEPQFGFGWTNGLIFELLDKWGRIITFPSGIPLRTTFREYSSEDGSKVGAPYSFA